MERVMGMSKTKTKLPLSMSFYAKIFDDLNIQAVKGFGEKISTMTIKEIDLYMAEHKKKVEFITMITHSGGLGSWELAERINNLPGM